MSPSGKIVLIVDDNPLNRELLTRTLRAEHYATMEAEDGVEALSVLEREAVDVVVCDVLMPNMDGYSLCREVRRRPELKDLFFILYTAANLVSTAGLTGLFVNRARLR
jgi:CheY-like chemotaxis protein